ncbi:hypothetical protein JTB14_026229 [Gonioctena quinquepunctata]|nr:hypothetical protein JTB14_026229 [Gonioctena quinquepunctata]
MFLDTTNDNELSMLSLFHCVGQIEKHPATKINFFQDMGQSLDADARWILSLLFPLLIVHCSNVSATTSFGMYHSPGTGRSNFTFNRFFIPAYSNFGLKSFTRNEIIVSIVEHSLPGMLIYVCGFFLLLHSLQNTFAELLCFGDRDWWNCRSYSEFFRNWNIIVHDWLYTYVYKDMHEHVAKNKALTKFVTFMLSAVVHEWVLTHMFGFFFPGVFIFFMFTAVISIVNIPDNTIFNVIFWMGLVMGCGVLVSGYTLEYFARSNLPPGNGSLRDFLLPRFLTCDYED